MAIDLLSDPEVEVRTMRINNSLSARFRGNLLVYYAFAVVATFVVLLSCHELSPFLSDPVPYILLFLVVACTAWYCGLGPAMAAVALALAGTRYSFTSPTRSFHIPDTTQSITMLVFLFACGATNPALGSTGPSRLYDTFRHRSGRHLRRTSSKFRRQ